MFVLLSVYIYIWYDIYIYSFNIIYNIIYSQNCIVCLGYIFRNVNTVKSDIVYLKYIDLYRQYVLLSISWPRCGERRTTAHSYLIRTVKHTLLKSLSCLFFVHGLD